jgi:hypothetical protein
MSLGDLYGKGAPMKRQKQGGSMALQAAFRQSAAVCGGEKEQAKQAARLKQQLGCAKYEDGN